MKGLVKAKLFNMPGPETSASHQSTYLALIGKTRSSTGEVGWVIIVRVSFSIWCENLIL